MALRRLPLLLRAYGSERAVRTAADVPTQCTNGQQGAQAREASLLNQVSELRKELATAQRRVAELHLSQVAVHEALLERLKTSDAAAHKAATQMRHTALALECSYDLLETELRRVLSIVPYSSSASDNDLDRIRLAAVEAGAREMVRKNIAFRVEKHAGETSPVE
uniref:Uncharacterized protein n=1 Tax=Trypanosoma congolense (strain IL3000) TaxID=1068625 RepID=G0UVA2_TRYCI|nr:conserved hypothetical protein [Trypanosoma congolense IL3000]